MGRRRVSLTVLILGGATSTLLAPIPTTLASSVRTFPRTNIQYGWWVEPMIMRDVWRSFTTTSGGPFVTITGQWTKQRSFVGHWKAPELISIWQLSMSYRLTLSHPKYYLCHNYINRFGKGTGTIWLDDVNCTGIENFIYECGHRNFGENNCGHGEDVGVICQRTCDYKVVKIKYKHL